MKERIIPFVTIILALFFIPGCHNRSVDNPVTEDAEFRNERKVTITGYSSDAMEPFITKDNRYLFFNNNGSNKDLFYAAYVNDTTFTFKGQISGVNSAYADATPSLDSAGHFFFMSTRELDSTFKTVFSGTFSRGTVSNVHRVEGSVNIALPYWINMGAAISYDGNFLFVSNAKFTPDGKFDFKGNIHLGVKSGTDFNLLNDEDKILANINTSDAAQYAPELSANGLELFYSQVRPTSPPTFELCYAKRENVNAPFDKPVCITIPFKDNPNATVEAPTLSFDGKRLYYHKKGGDKFSIFMLERD